MTLAVWHSWHMHSLIFFCMVPDTHEEDQILLAIHDSDSGVAHDG